MKFTRHGILLFVLILGLVSGAAGSTRLLWSHRPAQTEVASAAWNMSLQSAEGSSPRTAPGNAPLATHAASDVGLANPGSALPLLSIIGFGVLMGGIFSARRTR